MSNQLTKQQLDEMYQRPEKYPFERLNALMQWAENEVKFSEQKQANKRHANHSIGNAAKAMATSLLLLFALAFMSGCTKPSDKCAHVTCDNGGTCNNGTCACAAWYEGTNCENAMRDKFKGNWSGYLTDGSDGSVTPDFHIQIGNGANINDIIFIFDVLPIKATLNSSRGLLIPSQNIYYSGSQFGSGGSGSCPYDNHIILDFIIIWDDGSATNYHYEGSK